jgi:uncharacterized damage-inducible protein DinB
VENIEPVANKWLHDLYGHQAWADAEHWRAFGEHPAARDDEAMHNRLHHIHFVQHAFLWTVGERTSPFAMTTARDFTSFDALRLYARDYHQQIPGVLAGLSHARLAEPVSIVWFKDPPLTITVAEALTQCAMHAHYHRGQNATRLRELGGVPPTTDLIVWHWKGRPAGAW